MPLDEIERSGSSGGFLQTRFQRAREAELNEDVVAEIGGWVRLGADLALNALRNLTRVPHATSTEFVLKLLRFCFFLRNFGRRGTELKFIFIDVDGGPVDIDSGPNGESILVSTGLAVEWGDGWDRMVAASKVRGLRKSIMCA